MEEKRLQGIKCPNCGGVLGFINGGYSLRCGKCKLHPVVSGDTNKDTIEYKIKNKRYFYFVWTNCMENHIVFAPLKKSMYQPVCPYGRYNSTFLDVVDTYEEAVALIDRGGYKHSKEDTHFIISDKAI